jgi:cellulose synthase/poly-beta-1,6-N-acetylglucosamine synthase-like glycosyltransferase
VHWLRLPHGGKAKALNNALTHTVADVFITVDADTLLAPGAMAAFEQAFASDARLVAATGVLTPQCGPAPFGRALQWFQTHEYIRNFLTRHAWMKLDCLLLISGALGAYRRQSVVEVGGFDPDSLVEDYELIHRLRRHGARHQSGWRTAVIGQARASTEAPSTLGAFLRQRRRWFGGFLQTQCAYRDMVGDATYGATGTRMLPIKAVDTVQPLAGLSAMAMLLWLLLHARWDLLAPALWVMALKAAVDMIFLAWAARTHARWTGADQPLHWPTIVMLPLLEPLTFQMARHLAALLGWIEWLWGTPRWGDPARIGLRPGHLLVDPTLPGHRGFADTDASMRHKQ